MATVRQKRQAFQEILHGPGGHPAPSSYDVMSALLVERAGFDVAGALKALREHDNEVSFHESIPGSAEIRAFSGSIGSSAEDIVKRYYPAGAAPAGASS